ncbi:MAG: lipid-binding SYLF domain-containing protein [Synergistaceae bacterium]|jgi:lipid-binding SYLF domain-containing protein|nr:lipid-binding SYLF domain-containing protein [Synergistaceae bacterium]
MRTNGFVLLLLALFLVMFPFSVQAATPESLIKDSINMLNEMMKQDDAKSMADVIDGAKAIAFVPSMVKAGFVLGAEYGEGLVLRRENKKWYGPAFYNLSGGSLGLQIGAQKIALALVVINDAGVNAFLKSKTKLGADVAVAAGPVGRKGEAATDARMKASIYSYSMTKGLFAGLSLDGAVISISVKRDQEYWKKEISAADALKVRATDKRILPLIQAIESISKKAKKK